MGIDAALYEHRSCCGCGYSAAHNVCIVCVLERMGRRRIKIIVDSNCRQPPMMGRGAVEVWGRKFPEIHLPTEIWEGGGVLGLGTYVGVVWW